MLSVGKPYKISFTPRQIAALQRQWPDVDFSHGLPPGWKSWVDAHNGAAYVVVSGGGNGTDGYAALHVPLN